jgi:hypothetical protein
MLELPLERGLLLIEMRHHLVELRLRKEHAFGGNGKLLAQ